TAQVDALAFTEITLGNDTGDPLQGFGKVLVWKLAHVFRGDDLLDYGGLPLCFQRLADAGTVAVNHNLFDRTVVRRRVCGRSLGGPCSSVAPEQRHGDSCSHQGRPCDSHKFFTPLFLVRASEWRCSQCPATTYVPI